MPGNAATLNSASRAFPPPEPQATPVAWGRGRFRYSELPPFANALSVTVHGGVPFFGESDFDGGPCRGVLPLDRLGRARGAYVIVGPDTVQSGERPSNAGLPEPSGWNDARYPELSPPNVYDHSHVVAWALTGIFADPGDLITATTSLNRSGMKPYEDRVLRYVKGGVAAGEERRVLYRVIPRFAGKELVARGLLIEMASLGDRGSSLRDCAWCYNVRPGIVIDYATGASQLAIDPNASGAAALSGSAAAEKAALTVGAGIPGVSAPKADALTRIVQGLAEVWERAGRADSGTLGDAPAQSYVVVPGAAEFHRGGCALASGDRVVSTSAGREALIVAGYRPCERCMP